MSPEAQRIAIAEACGWTCIENRPSIFEPGFWLSGMNPKPAVIIRVIEAETGIDRAPNESDYGWESLPDYLNDLNACHEMEALVKKDVRVYLRYGQELIKLSGDGMFDAMFSTAPQRAEAFLKTLNLWIK